MDSNTQLEIRISKLENQLQSILPSLEIWKKEARGWKKAACDGAYERSKIMIILGSEILTLEEKKQKILEIKDDEYRK